MRGLAGKWVLGIDVRSWIVLYYPNGGSGILIGLRAGALVKRPADGRDSLGTRR